MKIGESSQSDENTMKFDSPGHNMGYQGKDMNGESISDLVNERRPGSFNEQRPSLTPTNINQNRFS